MDEVVSAARHFNMNGINQTKDEVSAFLNFQYPSLNDDNRHADFKFIIQTNNIIIAIFSRINIFKNISNLIPKLLNSYNKTLSFGTIKYDKRGERPYFYQIIKHDKNQLQKRLEHIIQNSKEIFENFLIETQYLSNDSIEEYIKQKNSKSLFEKFDIKPAKNSMIADDSESSDYYNSDSDEEISTDEKKYTVEKNKIEPYKNDEDICSRLDFDNYDEESEIYYFNPLDCFKYKLKEVQINYEILKEIKNFFKKLISHGFTVEKPIDYIMICEKNRKVFSFFIALNILTDLKPIKQIEPSKPKEPAERYEESFSELTEAFFRSIIKNVDINYKISDLIDPKSLELENFATSDNTLGKGGYATVYKNVLYGEEVAIKVPKEYKEDNVINEYELMKKSSNKNVCRVYGLVNYKNTKCMVMKYYPTSLSDRLKNLTHPEKVRIMAKVAQGLGHIHSQKIIHHDLKPSNVLLSRKDTPKISDFGLAESKYKVSNTDSGFTKIYADPRDYYNQVEYEADIWSFGSSLYNVLTGKKPYDHINESKKKTKREFFKLLIQNKERPLFDNSFVNRYQRETKIIKDCWDPEDEQTLSPRKIKERLLEVIKKI